MPVLPGWQMQRITACSQVNVALKVLRVTVSTLTKSCAGTIYGVAPHAVMALADCCQKP